MTHATDCADHQDEADLAVAAVRAGLRLARDARTREVIATKSGPNDLLTATDLAAELAIRDVLAAGSALPVQGEEGSADLVVPDRWVVDPIDGTANFVARLPLVACQVARVAADVPVAAAAGDLVTGEVLRAHHGGGTWLMPDAGAPTRCAVSSTPLAHATVTIGDLAWTNTGRWDLDRRARVLREAAGVSGRLRVVGTSVTELVWVATGRTVGAVLFGNHPWDVAAGVLAVREAGGVVRDAHGGPWSFDADSVLAAASEQVADALLGCVARAG